jgi:hypothetical protein
VICAAKWISFFIVFRFDDEIENCKKMSAGGKVYVTIHHQVGWVVMMAKNVCDA